MENSPSRVTIDDIKKRIAELVELRDKYPEIAALPSDDGLPAEQYRIWQEINSEKDWRRLLKRRTKNTK